MIIPQNRSYTIRIGFIDVNHLLSKKDDIQKFMLIHEVDILLLAETYLTSNVSDIILGITNYTLCSRNGHTHRCSLAVYVKNTYRGHMLGNNDTPKIEMLPLEVKVRGTQLLIRDIHRRPRKPVLH